MATSTRKKISILDINIPLATYSTGFDKELEAKRFSKLIEVPGVKMEFYEDGRDKGEYLLAISIPASNIAKPSQDDESVPEFEDSSVKRDFTRHAKSLVEKSAFLIASSNLDIDMEMI